MHDKNTRFIINLLAIGVFAIISAAALLNSYLNRSYSHKYNSMEKTLCRIISIDSGDNPSILCAYTDKSNQPATINITMNRSLAPYKIDDMLELCLDDESNTVWFPPTTIQIIEPYIFPTILFLLGLYSFFSAYLILANNKFLRMYGEFATGEVINFKKTSSKSGTFHLMEIQFEDNIGNTRIVNLIETQKEPSVGDCYDLKYAVRRNGKCIWKPICND